MSLEPKTTAFEELELYLEQAQKEIHQVFNQDLSETTPDNVNPYKVQGHNQEDLHSDDATIPIIVRGCDEKLDGKLQENFCNKTYVVNESNLIDTTISDGLDLNKTSKSNLDIRTTPSDESNESNQAKSRSNLKNNVLSQPCVDSSGQQTMDSKTPITLSSQSLNDGDGVHFNGLSQQISVSTNTSVLSPSHYSSVTNRCANSGKSLTPSTESLTPLCECTSTSCESAQTVTLTHGSFGHAENRSNVNEACDLVHCDDRAGGACTLAPHTNLSNSLQTNLFSGGNTCMLTECKGSLNEQCTVMINSEMNSRNGSDMEESVSECRKPAPSSDAQYSETCVNGGITHVCSSDKSPVTNTATQPCDDIDGFIAEITDSFNELLQGDKICNDQENENSPYSDLLTEAISDSKFILGGNETIGDMKKDHEKIHTTSICNSEKFPSANNNSICESPSSCENTDKCVCDELKSQQVVSLTGLDHTDSGVMCKEKGDRYVNKEIFDRPISNDEMCISNAAIKMELTDFDDTSPTKVGVVETDLGYYWLTSTIDEELQANVTVSNISMEEGTGNKANLLESNSKCEKDKSDNISEGLTKDNSGLSLKKEGQSIPKSISKPNAVRNSVGAFPVSKVTEIMSSFEPKFLSLDRKILGKKRTSQDDFQVKSLSNENLTMKPLRRKYSAPPSFCKVYKVISIDIPKMENFVMQDKTNRNSSRRNSSDCLKSGSLRMKKEKSKDMEKKQDHHSTSANDKALEVDKAESNDTKTPGKENPCAESEDMKSSDISSSGYLSNTQGKNGNHSVESAIFESLSFSKKGIHDQIETPTVSKDGKDNSALEIFKESAKNPSAKVYEGKNDPATNLNMQPTMVWDPGVVNMSSTTPTVPQVPPRTYANKLGYKDKPLSPQAPPPPSPNTTEQPITNHLNGHVIKTDQPPPLPERKRIVKNGNVTKTDKKTDKNVSLKSDGETFRKQHEIKGVLRNNLKEKHLNHKKIVHRLSGHQTAINSLLEKRHTRDMLEVLESYKFVENFGQSHEKHEADLVNNKHDDNIVAQNKTDSLDKRKVKSTHNHQSAVREVKQVDHIYSTVNKGLSVRKMNGNAVMAEPAVNTAKISVNETNVSVIKPIPTLTSAKTTELSQVKTTELSQPVNEKKSVIGKHVGRKPTDKPQSYSEGMKHQYEHSPDFQVMVNSLSPVLLRRNNSSRRNSVRNAGGSVETSPETTPNVSPRGNGDNTSTQTQQATLAVPHKNQHLQSLFIDPEMARTWHGATSLNWSKHYGPQMKAMMKELEDDVDREPGLMTNGFSEEDFNLELGSKTLPSKSLLDEMHKKFCSDQYHNSLESELAREMVLLKLKSQPTAKPKRSQSFNIRMGTGKSAISLNSNSSPRLNRVHKRVGIKTRPDFQYSPKPPRTREATPEGMSNIPVIKVPDSKREEAGRKSIYSYNFL